MRDETCGMNNVVRKIADRRSFWYVMCSRHGSQENVREPLTDMLHFYSILPERRLVPRLCLQNDHSGTEIYNPLQIPKQLVLLLSTVLQWKGNGDSWWLWCHHALAWMLLPEPYLVSPLLIGSLRARIESPSNLVIQWAWGFGGNLYESPRLHHVIGKLPS